MTAVVTKAHATVKSSKHCHLCIHSSAIVHCTLQVYTFENSVFQSEFEPWATCLAKCSKCTKPKMSQKVKLTCLYTISTNQPIGQVDRGDPVWKDAYMDKCTGFPCHLNKNYLLTYWSAEKINSVRVILLFFILINTTEFHYHETASFLWYYCNVDLHLAVKESVHIWVNSLRAILPLTQIGLNTYKQSCIHLDAKNLASFSVSLITL